VTENGKLPNVFAPGKRLLREFLRAVAFIFVFLSGALAAFMSQASAPNYQLLFWEVMKISIVHFALGLVYFLKVRHWTRWGALALLIAVLAFVLEMTYRVWL
jgi:hypothetical protein